MHGLTPKPTTATLILGVANITKKELRYISTLNSIFLVPICKDGSIYTIPAERYNSPRIIEPIISKSNIYGICN
jgi:hypothetical protein